MVVAHLHPQIEEMFDNVDLSVGGCGVQGGVALLVLAGRFRAVVHEQRHHVQVAFTEQAAETWLSFTGRLEDSCHHSDP